MGVDGIFGIFAIVCGLYCLYGFYMLKFKGEVVSTILLPKNVNIYKCKDLKGYCKEAQMPMLVLGATVLIYGATDLYNTYVGGAGIVFIVMLILMLAALVFFVARVRKINKKYFGI